jgi:hypothetical protein
MCGERRREFLKSIELLGNWMPICHACASRAAKLSPLPQTVGEIRRALMRERRTRERRRGVPDSRVFQYERRGSERRASRGSGDAVAVDDEMIIAIMDLASKLEASEDDLTRIVDARA